MSTKPILFNTDMVRALLANRKTVTRRVVKPLERELILQDPALKHRQLPENGNVVRLPYAPGDILYVRETWCWCYCWDCGMDTEDGCADETAEKFYNSEKGEWGCYGYRASFVPNEVPFDGWHPSIHMPREAARIFLRVTAVRVERLQDPFFKHWSTIFSLRGEGIDIGEQCRECIETYGSPCCIDNESECGVLDEVRSVFADLWNRRYAKPRPVKYGNGIIDHYESYPWEDIHEIRTYRGKPWYVIGNPWVWVIEFERVSREEAVSSAD